MEPGTITHSTEHYKFTAKLEKDVLSLQLQIKRPGNREILFQKTYQHADLPPQIQSIGAIKEVHNIFLDEENFKIDPEAMVVTVLVFAGLIRNRPKYEEVLLPLERVEIPIDTEVLMEEIQNLKEKVANLERRCHQPPRF